MFWFYAQNIYNFMFKQLFFFTKIIELFNWWHVGHIWAVGDFNLTKIKYKNKFSITYVIWNFRIVQTVYIQDSTQLNKGLKIKDNTSVLLHNAVYPPNIIGQCPMPTPDVRMSPPPPPQPCS